MPSSNLWRGLWDDIEEKTAALLRIFVDLVFLVLWLGAQWLVDTKVIPYFSLSGLSAWQLITFQVLFAVSSLIFIALYTYRDIRTLFLETEEQLLLKSHNNEHNRKEEPKKND